MKTLCKAVAILTLLSFIGGIFGCRKATKYTVEDICSLSVSCGHMDYSYSYSFYMKKDDGFWLLDADFATDSEHPHTEYEARRISDEDASELLNIVREQDVIKKLSRYKKPKIRVQVADETAYYTLIGFDDGESLGAAALISQELASRFFDIAAKYEDSSNIK